MWPDRRLIDLFKTEFPIVLAPMAGVMDADLVIAADYGVDFAATRQLREIAAVLFQRLIFSFRILISHAL